MQKQQKSSRRDIKGSKTRGKAGRDAGKPDALVGVQAVTIELLKHNLNSVSVLPFAVAMVLTYSNSFASRVQVLLVHDDAQCSSYHRVA